MYPLLRRVCAISFLCCSFCTNTFAQDSAPTSPPSSQFTPYPESSEGLKSLITDILVAIKSGDTQ